MYGKTATETFETSHNQIGNIRTELELAQRWPDWQLHVVTVSVRNDNFANVLTAADVHEGGDDLFEAIHSNRMDGSDMASFYQGKNLAEQSVKFLLVSGSNEK